MAHQSVSVRGDNHLRSMSASANSVKANRANAKRSTGPKTLQGKTTSSLNAIKHGLCKPVIFEAQSHSMIELVELLKDEITDQTFCEQIAIKIIELERTLNAQQAVAHRISQGQDGYRDEARIEKVRADAMFAGIIQGAADRELQDKFITRRKKEEMKLYKEIGKFFASVATRDALRIERAAIEDAAGLRRYYKRTTNQLIKAIKRAGGVEVPSVE